MAIAEEMDVGQGISSSIAPRARSGARARAAGGIGPLSAVTAIS